MEMQNAAPVPKEEPQDDAFASKYDYCMVFPMEDGKQTEVAKFTCKVLLSRGFEIFTYLSVQKDEFIVLIDCPINVVLEFADKVDWELELDPATSQNLMEAGDPEKQIAPCRIEHKPEITKYPPYTYIFGKYDQGLDQSLYKNNGDEPGELLGHATLLKLIYAKIEGPSRLGGCSLPIQDMLKHKKLLAIYPLHTTAVGLKLQNKMKEWHVMPWTQPKGEIKKYFGEKVALYFEFLGNYSYFLIFPAIIGLIFQLVVWGTNNYSSPVLPFFAVFICIWSIFMLEAWKRQEFRVALRWGMNNFESKELDRPEFKGKLIRSYVDGQELKYFPPQKQNELFCHSMLVIGTMIGMVVGVVAGIYVLRFQLQNTDTAPFASLIASVLNTVQITIFNMIYGWLSVKLTKYENHRTDTEYEDAMITKLFAFQFVNSYSSFFFLAFVASHLSKPDDTPDNYQGQCGAPSCMTPLAINIAIIFGTRITLTNALEVGIPYITYLMKRKEETKGTSEALTRPEEDYMLLPYDIMLESIKDYADTAIQYGFMTLFITALPIACFFALLTNIVKCKISAWKLFSFYQRPIPKGAEDIGSWQSIFAIISMCAVITNGALICFTMTVLDYSAFGKAWIFIGFQWAMISIQYIIAAIIPDKPMDVVIQEARTTFIVSKLIEKVADEDYDPKAVVDLNAPIPEEEDEAKLLKRLAKRKGRAGEALPDLPVHVYPRNVAEADWPAPLSGPLTPRGISPKIA